jgi:hypothetical protein
MAVFHLKYRDTRPILDVVLKNPDGSIYNLAGSTAWKLHIRLSDGTVVTRDMVKVGADADGHLQYTWVAADWNAGGLVASPSLPLTPGQVEHRMEYEVVGGTSRLTFPNDGYDILRILDDIGQG